jgi:predicted amidohydrolase
MRAFVAAAVQVAPEPGPLRPASIKANCAKAVAHVERCVEATGTELVVLPESVTTGHAPGRRPGREPITRARAYDTHVFVVAANAVGADAAGTLYFGNSLIVTPIPDVLARGTTHEGWIRVASTPTASSG